MFSLLNRLGSDRNQYNIQGVSASQLRLLRVQMVPLEGHSAAPSHAAAPLVVNSILVPTLPAGQQQQQQQSRATGWQDGAFQSTWTPYQSIVMNQTGWQEVVDEVWLSSDSTRGRWQPGHVTYSSPYPHAFIFEAVPDLAHLQYRGYVAVDDISFASGPCPGIIAHTEANRRRGVDQRMFQYVALGTLEEGFCK